MALTLIGSIALPNEPSLMAARAKIHAIADALGADPILASRAAAEFSDTGRWCITHGLNAKLAMMVDAASEVRLLHLEISCEEDIPDTSISAWRNQRGFVSAASFNRDGVSMSYSVHRSGRSLPPREVLDRIQEILGYKGRDELMEDLRGRNIVLADEVESAKVAARKSERQMMQAQKLEAIGQLTGGLAHDFNNVLAVVVGNLDLVKALSKDNERLQKHVNLALSASQRGVSLTKSLLAVASRQSLTPERVDVTSHLRDLMPLIQTTIGSRIKLADNLGEKALWVLVDTGGLDSALINLAANARDAIDGPGNLNLGLRTWEMESESVTGLAAGPLKAGTYAVLSVTDDGPGMPAEIREHAFDPFFTTKARGRGTGLGLAMVHGFCRQSGGDARIYSEKGQGTTMRLFLPLAVTGSEPAGRTAFPASFPAGKGEKVLLVDDEPDALALAAAWLEQMGYLVRPCTTPQEAQHLLHNDVFDLLLTDMVMQPMSGPALAEVARKLQPRIGILYVSGFANLQDPQTTVVAGALLEKPFSKQELGSAVFAALEQSPE